MKKAQKDMLKGGLVAALVLVYMPDYYAMLVDKLRGQR